MTNEEIISIIIGALPAIQPGDSLAFIEELEERGVPTEICDQVAARLDPPHPLS